MTILRLNYKWLRKVPAQSIADDLGLAKQTNTDWMSFCREVCYLHLLRNPQVIGGQDVLVEIDESKFDKRKYNRGKRVEREWVLEV